MWCKLKCTHNVYAILAYIRYCAKIVTKYVKQSKFSPFYLKKTDLISRNIVLQKSQSYVEWAFSLFLLAKLFFLARILKVDHGRDCQKALSCQHRWTPCEILAQESVARWLVDLACLLAGARDSSYCSL